jgi:hypothetical protein
MIDVTIRHAETEAELAACFPVMVLLRPHLRGCEEIENEAPGQQINCRFPGESRDPFVRTP